MIHSPLSDLIRCTPMAKRKRKTIRAEDLEGFALFKPLLGMLAGLRDAGTQRDRSGNRQFFFDQYCALMLLYFFNPILTSLRGIQQASALEKVGRKLGVRRVSLGSLSEARSVFDPELLLPIIHELGAQLPAAANSKREELALEGLTAVDGSLLPALPRMAWALWVDETHRAAKLHLAFEVFRGRPAAFRVTDGNASEREQLRAMLEAGRLYVIDAGYVDYGLYDEITQANSSFVARLRDNAAMQTLEERTLTQADRAAGVVRARLVRLGCEQKSCPIEPLLVVEIITEKGETFQVVTNRTELPPEVVALAYRYRWSVELFFRWFKCVLGCRHLLHENAQGVRLQVYLAILASLLVSLWAGRKPTKRTFEMICLYLSGWANEGELRRHIAGLKPQS